MNQTFLKAVIQTDRGLVDLKNPDIPHDILYQEYLIDTQLDIHALGHLGLDEIRLEEMRNRIEYIEENYFLLKPSGDISEIDDALAEMIDEILKKRIMAYAYGSCSDSDQDYPFRHTSLSLMRGPVLIRTMMLTITHNLIKEMPNDLVYELVEENFAIDGFSDGVLSLNRSEKEEIVALILDKEKYDNLFQSVLAY